MCRAHQLGTTKALSEYHLIWKLKSEDSKRYLAISSPFDSPSTGGGKPGSRDGTGPTSIGGGIGSPVNLRSGSGGGIGGGIGGATGGCRFGIGPDLQSSQAAGAGIVQTQAVVRRA